MIKAIKFRIEVCEKGIAYWKNKQYDTDSEKNMYQGIIIGLKSELETLNDLLKVADKSKELSA